MKRLHLGGASQAAISSTLGRTGSDVHRVLRELGLIGDSTIACRICQQPFRQLHRHLRVHGITAPDYRRRFGADAPFKSEDARLAFKRGKIQRGRPGPRLDYERIATLSAAGMSQRRIAEAIGCGRASVFRVLRRLREEAP